MIQKNIVSSVNEKAAAIIYVAVVGKDFIKKIKQRVWLWRVQPLNSLQSKTRKKSEKNELKCSVAFTAATSLTSLSKHRNLLHPPSPPSLRLPVLLLLHPKLNSFDNSL